MLNEVEKFIKSNQLIVENTIIVVGVSGGPDSLALLHYLMNTYHEKGIKLIAAHVDHMFRGKESEEDLLFVKRFCNELHIPFESAQIDVKHYQKEKGISSQLAARECRYRFFDETMKKYQAHFLALGHHGDDQVETVLMRLVRGALPSSFAGMRAKRPFSTGHIIRPFLSITKDDIKGYCEAFQLSPRIDPSNDLDTYTRNRFRHHVLPFLKEENKQVHTKFQRFSEIVYEDESLLQELTVQRMNTVFKKKSKEHVTISISEFLAMPKSLQRRGIQLILNYLYWRTSPDLSLIHIDNLLSFLEKEHPSGSLDFPQGLQIIRSYNECYFTFSPKKAEPFTIIIQNETNIQFDNGYELVCKIWENYSEELTGDDIFIIDSDSFSFPFFARTRKTGDKMTQKGMKGTKKVKDIFIDKKVDRSMRDTWPIITDVNDTILWIPLIKKSTYEVVDLMKDKYIVFQYKKY
ncbi:tRNA lysidine(34) synthetase TilS [Litchfieldia alkalitelluris]|uniref:tRNA lysidine(34) synthetase TilS n=1 Tax=Litchfieldia alkalitelluris TaxID=304268 RepID=UPI000998B5DA|nr:tRNA lysidine(34) synthetase TilS [Litchfieldia alkalitelluris]